jgi:hypothetical protein
MLIIGNVIIHYEHSAGEIEYSCAIILGFMVIAASKDEKKALKTN